MPPSAMEDTLKKIPLSGAPRKVSAVVGKGARAKKVKVSQSVESSAAGEELSINATRELGVAIMKLLAASTPEPASDDSLKESPKKTRQRIFIGQQRSENTERSLSEIPAVSEQGAQENHESSEHQPAFAHPERELRLPPKVHVPSTLRASRVLPAPDPESPPTTTHVSSPSARKILVHWLCFALNSGFATRLQSHPRALAALAVVGLFLMGLLIGSLQSRTAPETGAVTLAKPSPQLVKELNAALALIALGAADEALQKIQVLSATHPHVSSLDYLAALAALQAGDLKIAQEKASLSISKNQKVSDSLVLLSMTESGSGAGENSGLRDLKIVRESLLREAVNTDVSNPSPMIELASFLRSQKRDDEALELLHAANARLHPIDTHVVVETSIQLMKLQQTPDHELPLACQEGSITEIFSSIYISLRKKDYTQASIALDKCRHQASPDLFAYIINDPVFKPFHAEPLMMQAL